EGFAEGGVPLADQLGEQLVADAVAGVIEGGVGRVFAPGDGTVAEEAGDLGPLNLDQRADDAAARDRADGGESGGARAAAEAGENGFRLGGAGVSEGDAGGESTGKPIVEEGVAGVASGLLQVPGRGGE